MHLIVVCHHIPIYQGCRNYRIWTIGFFIPPSYFLIVCLLSCVYLFAIWIFFECMTSSFICHLIYKLLLLTYLCMTFSPRFFFSLHLLIICGTNIVELCLWFSTFCLVQKSSPEWFFFAELSTCTADEHFSFVPIPIMN